MVFSGCLYFCLKSKAAKLELGVNCIHNRQIKYKVLCKKTVKIGTEILFNKKSFKFPSIYQRSSTKYDEHLVDVCTQATRVKPKHCLEYRLNSCPSLLPT